MDSFNKIGAVDVEHAISLDEIGIRRNFIFNRLVDRGIFIECGIGRFYIDNEAARRFKERRREKARLILAGLIVIFIIYYLTKGR